MLKVIDLFSGCGGLSDGLRRVLDENGDPVFASVMAVECDPHAAETYRLNIGDHVEESKIENVVDFEECDVLVGGPPCQGFSNLNRNMVGAERRMLWKEYVRVLRVTEPEWFVMENVPQLLSSPEYEEFYKVAHEKLGYKISALPLNSADFGVPQVRRRAIVIGAKGVLPELPHASHGRPGTAAAEGDFLLRWVTVRDAIGDMAPEPTGDNWHRKRNPTELSLRRYRAVPADGGNRFEMQRALEAEGDGELVPPCWRKKSTGTTDVFGRMRWDSPAPTIRTEFYKPEKGRYLHPKAHRPITVREAARLMSFDDDFVFPEHQAMTHVGRQVGNAVPPLLGEAVGRVVAAGAGVLGEDASDPRPAAAAQSGLARHGV